MKAYRLTDNQFDAFVANLVEGQSVVGPVERSDQPGFYRFDRIETPGALVRHYTNTTLPPKAVFFPPQETVLILQFEADGRPRIEPQWRQEPFVLFGLHPCDLAAVEVLDLAYGFPPAEMRWGENRKKAAIIGLDCLPDDYCFCTSMGTEASRAPCDIFFTPIDDSWIAEVHSPIGAMLLSDYSKKPATPADRRAVEDRPAQKRSRIRTQLNASAAQFADILAMGGLTPIWQQTAERCWIPASCWISRAWPAVKISVPNAGTGSGIAGTASFCISTTSSAGRFAPAADAAVGPAPPISTSWMSPTN